MATLVSVQPPPRSGPVLYPNGTFTQPWSGWFRSIYNLFNYHSGQTATNTSAIAQNTTDIQSIQQSLTAGLNVTVTLARLTPTTGLEGSLTYHNGILTGYTAPT